MFGNDRIEDHAHHVAAHGREILPSGPRFLLGRPPRAKDQHDFVHHGRQNHGVAFGQHRRGIHNDLIKARKQRSPAGLRVDDYPKVKERDRWIADLAP